MDVAFVAFEDDLLCASTAGMAGSVTNVPIPINRHITVRATANRLFRRNTNIKLTSPSPNVATRKIIRDDIGSGTGSLTDTA